MRRRTSPRQRQAAPHRDSASLQPVVTAVSRRLRQKEVWGLACVALGVLTLTTLVTRDQGRISEAWSLMVRQALGIGAYPAALGLVAAGLLLMVQNTLKYTWRPRVRPIVGWEILFFSLLAFIHVVSPASPLTLAQQGRRGGYIGWAYARVTVPYIGRGGGAALAFALCLVGAYLAAGVPWQVILWRIRWAWAQIGVRWRRRIVLRRLAARPDYRGDLAGSPALRTAPVAVPEPTPSPARKPRKRSAPAARAPVTAPPAAEPAFLQPKPRFPELPPLDLLISDQAVESGDADARQKAEIIEETLTAFGVPAQVVEWHRGPVVTQFGVEPGFIEHADREGGAYRLKVRVSKIISLQNDLALALAAAPIRIEAPVPGRAVVGIEVPNDTKAIVGLRSVLESEQFRKERSRLKFGLGRDVSGEAVVADLESMPHLLIAGATGTGKSVCLNAIVVSLLFQNTPEQLRLLLIDPKRVELTSYNGIPHLIAPVVVDVEKVISALRWTVREMENRYKELARVAARNIEAYNRMATKQGLTPMPAIVVVIDELADLMMAAPEDVERTICRIAQMARATGIHLVIATQRPSVDVVTGLIKANFPTRISFLVSSQVDARVVLDTPGAEKLLGRGDMLYMASDSPKLLRIQGCFVSDQEVRNLVGFWRARAPSRPTEPEAAPWDDGTPGEESEDDALLERATRLVRERRQASASFLQRQMRIGYPRAARLIDQLEEAGVIGPAEGGGRSRPVIGTDEASSTSEDSG